MYPMLAHYAKVIVNPMASGGINVFEFIRGLSMVYRGTLSNHPKVDTYKAKSIAINPKEPLYLQADGELLGHAPASFKVLPQALRIAIYNAS